MVKVDKKRVFIYSAVIALLVFLYAAGPLRTVEGWAARYLNPVISRLQATGAGLARLYSEQSDRSNLNETVNNLENRVNELTRENAELKSLEDENRTLREQLGFFTKSKHRYVMANVVSRGDLTDTSGQTESITIDKGMADGVIGGLAVLSSDGILVGKVVETKDNLASVYLTNNPKCKAAATILNQGSTAGVAQGELGLTIKMDFIPQSVNISPGDLVITSGLEQYIPRGLAIGSVISVNKENNELWQTATIEPLTDPDKLNIVSVIIQ